jgi:hypothetical protein
MTARVLAYARISPAGLLTLLNGEVSRKAWSELTGDGPGSFGIPPLKARWFFDEPYPKFGRMDPLCKLGVAVSQLLAPALKGLPGDDVAMVGGTQLGCLEVDAQFEKSRQLGTPSPALFVYTLPSMFLGEIAIAHRLRGRCTLLSAGALSGLTALATAVRWIEKGRAKYVLAVAADAAGPAAQALDAANKAQSAAAAWLIGPEGNGPSLHDVRFDHPPSGARVLPAGELRFGLTCVDTLEQLLLSGESGPVAAVSGDSSVGVSLG